MLKLLLLGLGIMLLFEGAMYGLFPKKMMTSLNNDQTNIIDKIFDNQYITYYNDRKYYKSYEVAKMLCKFPDLESLDDKTKIRQWLEIKEVFFILTIFLKRKFLEC